MSWFYSHLTMASIQESLIDRILEFEFDSSAVLRMKIHDLRENYAALKSMRLDEAIEFIKIQEELNPGGLDIYYNLSCSTTTLDQMEECDNQLRRTYDKVMDRRAAKLSLYDAFHQLHELRVKKAVSRTSRKRRPRVFASTEEV